MALNHPLSWAVVDVNKLTKITAFSDAVAKIKTFVSNLGVRSRNNVAD
jgi:hypothetical protein